jgi:hypothetical protein
MAWGTAAAVLAAHGTSPDQWPILHPIGSFFVEHGAALTAWLPAPDFPDQHVDAAFLTGVTLRGLKNLVLGTGKGLYAGYRAEHP